MYKLSRIRQAIEECDRYIAKESPRDPALRPAEIASLLAHTIAHRDWLIQLESEQAALERSERL